MKISKSLRKVLISILFYVYYVLPFATCSSLEVTIDNRSPSNLKNKGSITQDKLMSNQMINNIKLHGLLLWISIGILMPMGILFIRMANKAHENGRKVKVFFYLHVVFQILAVVLATIGAIMSLRTLENSFDNNHQRLGLALYAAMWLQFLTGVFKPSRGSNRRLKWFLLHWILGTIVSIFGIINIYTGIRAYQKKTSSTRDSSLWTILFTVQVSCLIFFYLFQDKWEHFQKQRVVLDELDHHHHQNNNPNRRSSDQIIQVETRNDHEQKVMVPQPCRKSNALVNLFKLI